MIDKKIIANQKLNVTHRQKFQQQNHTKIFSNLQQECCIKCRLWIPFNSCGTMRGVEPPTQHAQRWRESFKCWGRREVLFFVGQQCPYKSLWSSEGKAEQEDQMNQKMWAWAFLSWQRKKARCPGQEATGPQLCGGWGGSSGRTPREVPANLPQTLMAAARVKSGYC